MLHQEPASDRDRSPIRLSRAVTIGLITTCSNRATAVWGSAGRKALVILIIGRSKYRQLRSDTPTMTRRCAQQSL
jgi:hypothetical protein